MHFYVESYKSNEFIEIYRVWHEKVKNLTWKSKNLKNLIKMGLDSPVPTPSLDLYVDTSRTQVFM